MCDLRNLNKSVKSDCSIFQTPNKVMQSLKSSSKFFIKNNLLQGYHQIPISMKSRNLFCFSLEDGLFWYTRALMGYSGSSHYFNRIIQKIFEDIPDTHIEIDNLLTETESMEEAIAIFRKILVHWKEKHIKLARHKLEFGREVEPILEAAKASIQPLPKLRALSICPIPPTSPNSEASWEPGSSSVCIFQTTNILSRTCKNCSGKMFHLFGTISSKKILKVLRKYSEAVQQEMGYSPVY